MISMDLIRRRRAVMASGLPPEYQRVAWIGHGTVGKLVYIDTGFIPTGDSRVVTAYERTAGLNTRYPCVYGVEEPRFSYIKGRFDYNKSWSFKITDPGDGAFVAIDHDKNYASVNGTLYGPMYDYANFTCPGTLYLFNDNGYVKAETQFYGKIFYCKIYDNGTLAKDLVPCRRKDDAVLGMYDRVGRAFLTPPSNGEYMTAGEDIL